MEGKSIIAVSDVHLGMTIENGNSYDEEYEKYRESQFRDFLDTLDFSHISDFVLLGDILDFWRHDFLNVIADESCHIDKLKELIEKYRDNTKFHYIAGNHDYHLLWLKENGADYPFDIKKSVVIQSNKKEFYFIHGYELEVLSWSSYKPLPLYESFSEDMCLVGEEGSWFADNMWKNYLEHSSRVKPKSIIEEIMSKAEEILSNVHREKSLISSQMLDMKEILCKAEEILSPSNHEKIQISSPISDLINISKLVNQLEQFIEEAKELNKNIEESKSVS